MFTLFGIKTQECRLQKQEGNLGMNGSLATKDREELVQNIEDLTKHVQMLNAYKEVMPRVVDLLVSLVWIYITNA